MMPAGREPEAGLAGVWRVIGAEPAPWSTLRRLTQSDAPLLEYAVNFGPGEVRGPPPLSCAGASYSSGVTYRNEVFGGALARGETPDATAMALKLGNPQLTTFRVYCGEGVRDFYIDDDADLVTIERDVVYRLERPTGMDPQQYQPGYSGPSFDCTTAKTTGERLICIDASLSKSDKKLGDGFGALRTNLSPASLATFVAAQSAWTHYVMDSCGAEVPMPATLGDRNAIVDCLRGEYEDRATLLSDLKVERAGLAVLEPRMRFRVRAEADIAETDVYPWISGGPYAATFNAFVFRKLSLNRWRMDDKRLFTSGDAPAGLRRFARLTYAATRFDGRIASFQVSNDDYTGGNRDVRAQQSLTWDLRKARPVTLGDVFATDRAWKRFVIARCKEQLHDQFSERNAPDLSDAEIATTIIDSRNWLWSGDKATVVFLVGTIGGLTGGEFDVEIPLAALRRYMKTDAPVR